MSHIENLAKSMGISSEELFSGAYGDGYDEIGMVEQQIEEIRKKFADGLDIDYTLKEISEGIFSLDEQYLGILVMLANNPATEYHLGKAGKEYGLDRDSVRRRLLGTKSLPSLEELEFVRPEEDLFRTGKKIKTYSLTIKGISASLSQTKFEDIFNIQIFKKNIHALTDNQFNIDDLIILYIKYHTALVMSWCEMNNSNITKTTLLEDVFHESFIPRILTETTSNPLVDERVKATFVKIVKLFVSIRHVVKQIISMMVDTKSAPIFGIISNFSSTKMKNLSKENLGDYLSHILIKDWYGYVNQAVVDSDLILDAYGVNDADDYSPLLLYEGHIDYSDRCVWSESKTCSLGTIIIRLNDTYRLTFEQVADFLEVTFDL